MARCTKEEALETRSRILDAAEDVFHRQGVAATSLNEVAEAAGLTRGAIYWHFKNKHELFDALCERIRLPMEARMSSGADENEPDPLGRLRDTLVFALVDAASNPAKRKVLDIIFNKSGMADPDDAITVRRRAAFEAAIERIERTLDNAIRRGQLPPSVDVRFGAMLLHSILKGVLQDWLFAPERFDLAFEAPRFIDAGMEALRCAHAMRKGG